MQNMNYFRRLLHFEFILKIRDSKSRMTIRNFDNKVKQEEIILDNKCNEIL